MDDDQTKNIEKKLAKLEKKLANYGKVLYALIETLDGRSKDFEDLFEEFHNSEFNDTMNKEA